MNGLRSHIKQIERVFHQVSKHRLIFSIHFLVFGYPDETLFLVFELHNATVHNTYYSPGLR